MNRVSLTTMLAVTLVTPAFSAGFSVNPIRLELNPAQRATSLTIVNYNSTPLVMQVRVYRWAHQGEQDVLSEDEADAPLVTPPLFRLKEDGGSQIIRIGFASAVAAPNDERQWRVIIEEVSTSQAAAAGLATAAGAPLSVAVRMRLSLPLFQRPLSPRQDLQWTLQREEGGGARLIAQNLGSVTERLDALELIGGDDRHTRFAGPVYVFPGERRSFDWHSGDAQSTGTVRLSLQGTARPLVRELTLRAQ